MTNPELSPYAVEMLGTSKAFGHVNALSNVDLKVKRGSIHALLGENGAGKTTLMNILYGFYSKDSGTIKINGGETDIKNPRAAIEKGIGMVHQHFMLVHNFTVAENVVLGNEVTKGFGRMDREKMNREVADLSKKYGLEVDPTAVISDVSVATQQRVEILKALYRGIDILILDEPTAVLTPIEIESLIKTMRMLVNDGKTIIIITHKLKEIKMSADYCTIVRRGEYIDTVRVAETSETELASLMVGRAVNLSTDRQPKEPGSVVLEVKNLVVRDSRGIAQVNDLSITVRHGEIVGIAGIDGNGQSEFVNAITGLIPAESGSVMMNGKEIINFKPKAVQKAGIKTIHEDRQHRGLVLDFTVAENLILETYDQQEFSKNGSLKWDNIYDWARKQIEGFDIRPGQCERDQTRSLSGGNQQKLIIAREVQQNPDLLIAMQPTRGLDVGAIEFVRKALVEQRNQNKAVLLISFELDEILDISDHIYVLYAGKVAADIDTRTETASETEIGLYMAGGGK